MADRKLVVKIVGDASSFERAMRNSTKSVVSFRNIAKATIGFTAITEGIRALEGAIRGSASEFAEQAKVAAQTEAVIKSTGAAAGVTAKEVDKLSASISAYSGIDDEAVQAGQNLLLTFPKIRNEVGKGNAIFTRATKTVADLSVAMGIDMRRAALQVGKALNDPERGYTRLQRIGVAFAKTQIAQIKNFTKSGQVAKAQQVILAELNREFGGSAKALGETIPGQLNRLRETLRNIGGDLVGKLAPAFTRALESANKFVAKVAQADGVKAKLRVVFQGIEGLGRDLYQQVADALARVDWDAVVSETGAALGRAFRSFGRFLDDVDFSNVGRRLGEALARGLNDAAAFLGSVDWSKVGEKITNGIGAFLKGFDWGGLARSSLRLLAAAFRSVVELNKGAYKAVGSAIVRSVGDGIGDAAGYVKRKALEVAKSILEALDLKILGRSVVPGVSQLRKGIEGELEQMAKSAEKQAKRVQAAATAIAAATGNPGVRGTAGAQAAPTARIPAPRASNTSGTSESTIPAWIKRWQKAADALQFAVDQAGLALSKAESTPTLRDDITAYRQISVALAEQEKSIRNQIGLHPKNLDLRKQLLAVQQQQVGNEQALTQAIKQRRDFQIEAARQARNAAQFKALGLTATGDTPIPGIKALKRQLSSIGDAVKGTFLDTGKTRSLLQAVRRILSGGLGKVSDEVRSKVKEMLDGIDSQLKERGAGQITKARAIDTRKLLANAGLSADQLKEVSSRLSRFNSSGVALAGASGGKQQTIVIQPPDVILDGEKVSRINRRHDQVHARRNPKQKRGPNRPF